MRDSCFLCTFAGMKQYIHYPNKENKKNYYLLTIYDDGVSAMLYQNTYTLKVNMEAKVNPNGSIETKNITLPSVEFTDVWEKIENEKPTMPTTTYYQTIDEE